MEAQIVERLDKPGYVRGKIVFSDTRYSRVPGYLAIPKSSAPSYPCVLQIRGLTSSKESWWEENETMGQLTRQLLMAEKDERKYSVDAARHLHELIISNTKDLVFYESRHMLPGEWTNQATEWMKKHLK